MFTRKSVAKQLFTFFFEGPENLASLIFGGSVSSGAETETGFRVC